MATGEMKSVIRSLKVLELVAEHQPISVGELAKLTGTPKSTLQRTLTTLYEASWLRQAASETTRWEVSARVLAVRPPELLGGLLYAASREPMVDLRDATHETVHLSVPEGVDRVVLVFRVDCDQPVRTFSPIGDVSPSHATSTGKAILAFLPESQLDLLSNKTLTSYTPRTSTELKKLRAELKQIRERGYAVNQTEYRPQVCSVGAPIFDAAGVPFASMCISMPQSRFDEGRVPEWGRLVREAAERIGAAAGGLSHQNPSSV